MTLLLLSMMPGACKRGEEAATQLSEAPAGIDAGAQASTVPRPSRLGVRARIGYRDIEAIASRELPDTFNATDRKQVCKKVLGLSVCGTANWNVDVTRSGPLTLTGAGDAVVITAPLRFDGTVGIRGKVARALRLDALDVEGAAQIQLRLGLSVSENWCPEVEAVASYTWSEKPEIEWQGGLKLDLRGVLDKELDKQLDGLGPRINRSIDCESLRRQLAGYWRSYTFPLSLPHAQTAYLNVEPMGFAYSGIRAEPDALGVSFALDANTVVESTASAAQARPLPTLQQVEYAVGKTGFDVLLRADYAQLDAVATPQLVGKRYSADTAAGDVSVEITAIGFSGNARGLTVTLGFSADLPASSRRTHGVLYLTARPVVDVANERVTLTDIQFSRVLDNRLWSLVGALFETRIIDAIREKAVFDLSERTAELEAKLSAQLSDPERTNGVEVTATGLDIKLIELIPEAQALAARALVTMELDVNVPEAVLAGGDR